ncbi:glycosyltransferase [Flavobacteriales bacterium]|nr:glycosyltransferase [Flavobacteriales bacterium]
MTKLLFLMPFFGGGGSQRTYVNLIKFLAKTNRYQLHVFVLRKEGSYKFDLPENIIIHTLQNGHQTRNAITQLPRIVKEVKPEVIISSLFSMNFLAFIIKITLGSGSPKIIMRQAENVVRNGKLSKLNKIKLKTVFTKADKIISLSQGVKNEMIKELNINSNNIHVVQNPVDINKILENKRTKESDKYFHIAWIGRLSFEKNLGELIEASKLLSFPFKCHIMGEGDLLKTYTEGPDKEFIKEHFIFHGFVKNPYEILMNTNTFILTSIWEGLGHVLLEAMLCRIPVISSNCNYGPIELINNGQNGLLYNLGSPQDLANKITDIRNDDEKAKQLAEKAYHFVLKNFNLEVIGQQYESVIKELT